MENKRALEIINEEGFGIETMEELFDDLGGGDTLYGKTSNLIIEIEDEIITLIEKEPVVERETIFERDED